VVDKESTSGRGKRGGALCRDFARLPVYFLHGGDEAERLLTVRRLMAELTQRDLSGVFLRRGGEVTQHQLVHLVGRYDVIFVNGHDLSAQAVAWQQWSGDEAVALRYLQSGERGWAEWVASLLAHVESCSKHTPVWAVILIGGKSSRMGTPKHLIRDTAGRTWLERTLAVLQPMVDGLVVAGGGRLPPSLESTPRLLDLPGVGGPMTGILAAMRWQPLVSWLVMACDMPLISEAAARWLLSGRRPGCWGRVPTAAASDRLEPLFSWYDFRAAPLFEEQLHRGNWRLSEAAAHHRLEHPVIPAGLSDAWVNINTPQQLAALD
jgi:molybdopterin-guanine dinucleotide biosynthesis protein A